MEISKTFFEIKWLKLSVKKLINKGKKCMRILISENEFHLDKKGAKRIQNES